jgi:VWFA-related protein
MRQRQAVKMKRTLALCLLLSLTLSGFAQQPPQKQAPPPQPNAQTPERANEDDVVRITTNLVQVDAVITDKNGRQITDLRPEELQILEDGTPQTINNFSYVSLDSASRTGAVAAKPVDKNAPPLPPVKLRPEQVRRTIALVVDDLGLSFESIHFVRDALKKFLDQQMQPNDLVAIIRTAGGIGALQQFTSDKRQLYAALDRVKWSPSGRGGIGVFSPITNSAPQIGVGSNATLTSDADQDLERFREDIFSVGTLGAINYVVRGLRTLPGRKSVVVMSDGIKIFHEGDSGGGQRVLDALRNLTDQANRASVVIYTMDARGLQTLGFTAADSSGGMNANEIERSLADRRTSFFESQNGLFYLAEQTGGFAVVNNNDLAGGIKRVIEDQKGYYLIGYRPDESTFDKVSGRRKFHKLTLRVLRPGKFNVRVRNGFFGITDEDSVPTAKTRVAQLNEALTSPFGSAGVHLRLTSLFSHDPKTGSVMRSMLHVNARDLTFTEQPDGWHQVVFDILAVTFGDNGVVVDQISRTHTMRLKGKTYERILNEGFVYNVLVPVKKAGAYQLRTALRDTASEHVGSASQFIEVPDIKKNRLTLSGVLVRGLSLQTYLRERGAANPDAGTDNSVDQADPASSAALRRFNGGMVMLYGVAIYNAQVDKQTGKPNLQTQIRVFRDGELVFSGEPVSLDTATLTDFKQLPVTGALELGAQMVPGEYVLQVITTDLLAKEKRRLATQWIDFEIVKKGEQ